MNDKVLEARRALFEAWYEARSGYKPALLISGRYSNIGPELAWTGFNAALDAVEIELPEYTDEVRQYGYAAADVRAAIESTNLGLRVK